MSKVKLESRYLLDLPGSNEIINLSHEEAQALYNELKKYFDMKLPEIVPNPYNPWTTDPTPLSPFIYKTTDGTSNEESD